MQETGIKTEAEAVGIKVVAETGSAEPGKMIIVQKEPKQPGTRTLLKSHVSELSADEEKLKNEKPKQVEKVSLDTIKAEKIVIKINVKSHKDIPRGLRQEVHKPDYLTKRVDEIMANDLDVKKVQAQRPGIFDNGIDKGNVHQCECLTIFNQLFIPDSKGRRFYIEDAHWKDSTVSQQSKAKGKKNLTYPVFITLALKGPGIRLAKETFDDFKNLLSKPNEVHVWDNRHLANKKNIVLNLSSSYNCLEAKNKLVL